MTSNGPKMKKSEYKELICEILGISPKSYYRWKEERKIFQLLDYAFSADEIKEWLKTGKVERLEEENKVLSIELRYAIDGALPLKNAVEFTTKIFPNFHWYLLNKMYDEGKRLVKADITHEAFLDFLESTDTIEESKKIEYIRPIMNMDKTALMLLTLKYSKKDYPYNQQELNEAKEIRWLSQELKDI